MTRLLLLMMTSEFSKDTKPLGELAEGDVFLLQRGKGYCLCVRGPTRPDRYRFVQFNIVGEQNTRYKAQPERQVRYRVSKQPHLSTTTATSSNRLLMASWPFSDEYVMVGDLQEGDLFLYDFKWLDPPTTTPCVILRHREDPLFTYFNTIVSTELFSTYSNDRVRYHLGASIGK